MSKIKSYLGVDTLSDFHATMSDGNTAVPVKDGHVDIMLPSLVENAPLHWHNCQTTLFPTISLKQKYYMNLMLTAHYTTRQDKTSPDKKICNVRRSTTRHHKTKNRALSQISSIVRSLTTRSAFCLGVSHRVVDPRTLHKAVGTIFGLGGQNFFFNISNIH